MSTGALLGAFSRFATLIGCGVPSMSSGGISVVSGMLAPLEADAPSVEVESDAPLSPQPEKISALEASVSNARFFIIFGVFFSFPVS